MTSTKWNPGQEAAIQIDGRDLMVTAGAGTGKTTVLVARILRLLTEREFDLGDLLVVTFTDKAAREMKERIYTEIARRPELRHHLPQIPRAQISTIHGFCAGLLRENFLLAGVEPAFRVLDENGQIEALAEALRKTLHEWYLLDGEEGDRFRRLVELAGFNEKGEALREIVRRLYEYARSTPEFETYLEEIVSYRNDPNGRCDQLPWWSDFVRIARRDWSEAVELYRAFNVDAAEESLKVGQHLVLAELLVNFDPANMGEKSAVEVLRGGLLANGFLSSLEDRDVAFPRAPNGANKRVAGYKVAMDEAKKTITVLLPQFLSFQAVGGLVEQANQTEDLRILVALVREMEGYYSQHKRQGGWLDYGDLEVKAAHFVRRHGQALGLKNKYREVMVDEYQDTNHLQESILSGVSKAGCRFRVGDVKQSIYQFRLADPSIFLDAVRGSLPVRSLADLPESGTVAQGDRVAAGDGAVPGDGIRPGAVDSAGEDPSAEEAHQFSMLSPPPAPAQAKPWPGPDSDLSRGSDMASTSASALGPVAVFLTENYRSHPEILSFVNYMFSWLFDESTIGSDYSQQALHSGMAKAEPNLDSGGEPGLELPTVARVELNFVQTSTKVEENRLLQRFMDPSDLQPRWVARRLASLANDPVLQDDEGKTDWSGVAILLRSRVRASLFVEALRRENIPATLSDGSTFFDEPLVRDLRSLLQVIDNPRNDVALAAVLRSPIYSLTDGDLLRLRMAWPHAVGFLDGLVGAGYANDRDAAIGVYIPAWPSPRAAFSHWVGQSDSEHAQLVSAKLRGRVRAALDDFQRWRSREAGVGLTELVRELSDETRLVSRITASGETAHPARVLDRILALASAFENERGPSLHGFLSRLDALEDSGRMEGGSLDPDQRGVQVMTIHKSKGLEFPVVVVPQLEWRFSSKDRLASRIRIGSKWVGVRQFDEETYSRREANGRRVLEWMQEGDARDEEARVLYVALTRARDRLLLFSADRFHPAEAEAVPTLLSDRRKRTAFDRLRWFKEGLPWDELREVQPDEFARQGFDLRDDLTWDEFVERDKKRGGLSLGTEGSVAPSGSIDPAREWVLTDPVLAIRWVPKARLVSSLCSAENPVEVDTDATEAQSKVAAALNGEDEFPPLPGDSSNAEANETVDTVLRRASIPPLAQIEGLRGKYWVTEFKGKDDGPRRVAMEQDGVQVGWPFIPPKSEPEEDPTTAGVRYHQALALLDLTCTSPKQILAQFETFSRSEWWDGQPRDESLEEGVVSFFAGDLGQELAAAAAKGRVEREVSFSLKWSVADLRDRVPDLNLEPDERWSAEEWAAELQKTWVLLQGRIDCVFATDDRWVVIDWKTDRVDGAGASTRAKGYRHQMELYRDAVSRLWGSPVAVEIVFLRPGIVLPGVPESAT